MLRNLENAHDIWYPILIPFQRYAIHSMMASMPTSAESTTLFFVPAASAFLTFFYQIICALVQVTEPVNFFFSRSNAILRSSGLHYSGL